MPNKKLPFEVIHVSGSDEGYSAKELEIHSPTTRGWQSVRFCEYPQEIIFALKEQCNIFKIQVLSHQHNIASKIEIFIGMPTHSSSKSLRDSSFTRLGYVQLSPNEGANFQARELKSVMIDRDGVFVKMLIHKNHINKLNYYNQVCVVAVNILGYPLSKQFDDNVHDVAKNNDIVNLFMNQKNETINTSLLNGYRFIDGKNTSQFDDLSFDMYQDPETAQLIRKLDDKKREAIMEERYDYAKKLKAAISDLYKVGEKLGKFEVEKRRAVEVEDFDTAKKKKIQSDEYRLNVYKQLDVYDLLEISKRCDLKHSLHLHPLNNHGLKSEENVVEKKSIAEIKLPHVLSPSNTKTVEDKTPQLEPITDISKNDVELTAKYSDNSDINDERPLPSLSKHASSEDTFGEQQIDVHHERELHSLTEKEEREAELIIDIFGMNIAQQLYSKSWKHRQESLMSLTKAMKEEKDKPEGQKPKEVSRAVVSVLKRTMNDQVLTVLNESVVLLKSLLHSYIPKETLGKAETTFVIDKLLPIMMRRAGDAAPRTKNLMSDSIIDIAKSSDVKGSTVIPTLATDSFKGKKQPPWRLLKSQIEILQRLVQELGVDTPGGLTTDRVMKVLLSGLEHPNNDVRDASIACIVEVYKIKKDPLKSYLPPDEHATRKNPLYVKLFDCLDRADGKPTEAERRLAAKKEKDGVEKSKQEEINALKTQLDEMREIAQTQLEAQSSAIEVPLSRVVEDNNNESQSQIKEKTPLKNKLSVQTQLSNYNSRPISQRKKESRPMTEKMCIFCGEASERFDDNGLDIHYWKSCPMLKRCESCSQVVEISCISQHLLSECDMKGNYIQCNKCGLAIHKSTEKQHRVSSTCKVVNDPEKLMCPLCSVVVQDTEEGWKAHLVDKCRVNVQRIKKERLPSRKPQSSVNKMLGRGRSQIPTSRGGRGASSIKAGRGAQTPGKKK